jgi:hypothetical protein
MTAFFNFLSRKGDNFKLKYPGQQKRSQQYPRPLKSLRNRRGHWQHKFLMSSKIKKQCAIPNCSNPKCPFPHAKPTDKIKSPPKPKAYLKPLPLFNYKIPPISRTEDLVVVAPSVLVTQVAITNASPLHVHTEALLRKCKRCGGPFTMGVGELNWYVKKGFDLPKRCKECRISNRLEGKEEVIAEKIDDTIWV